VKEEFLLRSQDIMPFFEYVGKKEIINGEITLVLRNAGIQGKEIRFAYGKYNNYDVFLPGHKTKDRNDFHIKVRYKEVNPEDVDFL